MGQQSSIKLPATFEEQLHILKRRGLVVEDDDFAIRALQRINYYRLSAYGLSLKNEDQYRPGTTFSQIYSLYEFDHRFRYIIMEMTEQVEIAFRTHISYHIAHAYGPVGHYESVNFEKAAFHAAFLAELDKEIKRSQEIFVHIAKSYYQLPAVYLESWLKCLSYIRNICAHYGRLYNRPLTSKPRLYSKEKSTGIRQDRVFAHIYVLKQMISDRDKWNNSFVVRLQSLLAIEEVNLEEFAYAQLRRQAPFCIEVCEKGTGFAD
ncbi:Abi family protein [Paenibacillus sp. NEAU-GSW1]|uniref:Abi family protein n=1 Tax=Paenibacillus sp. NEAU-GSW1 TaxID=2682486 RepID=UPI0015643A2A|nr:Abi family protein [Paenibacillus sp. NEAU-GSW1]